MRVSNSNYENYDFTGKLYNNLKVARYVIYMRIAGEQIV